MTASPVNYRKHDPGALHEQAAYALGTARGIEALLARWGREVKGTRLLELGPGTDFGAQLILASMGAEVVLADRFLATWDNDFHPKLYARLCELWSGPKEELQNVLRSGHHQSSSLVLLEEPAESLASVSDASIDVVYSNAVLEHIVDLRAVATEMARVLKPGGWAAHQIDWRHHVNFNRPLEHLLLTDEVFLEIAEAVHYECGNRLRSSQFWAEFEAAGLTVTEREVNGIATETYFGDFLPRLRASSSRYRDWPEADLRRISGRFFLHKADGPEAAVTRERGHDLLAVQAAFMAATSANRSGSESAGEVVTLQLRVADASPDGGFCWKTGLPDLPAGDTATEPYSAALRLTENGKALGPAHAMHAEIRAKGGGRYSHWHHDLYFSASDNSPPVTNGRHYAVEIPKRWIEAAASTQA